MNDELKQELAGLENLQSAGTLDDTQTARLAEIKGIAEKTAQEERSNELKSALAQKEHFRTKFEKEEQEKKKLQAELANRSGGKSLDVEDYIDISASLEGLDSREKEKLAKEHKLTGRPLNDIREDEDFKLWQNAYRGKLEKEKALAPSSKQSESDKPQTLLDRLAGATMAEKEKLLAEAGLYKNPQGPRSDRQYIGSQR